MVKMSLRVEIYLNPFDVMQNNSLLSISYPDRQFKSYFSFFAQILRGSQQEIILRHLLLIFFIAIAMTAHTAQISAYINADGAAL